jgi:putative transcriptional regulator
MPEVSLKGRLLVANPALPDPNFDRTVVLLLAHEDEGALGLVLNRPSDTEVDGPLPQWERLAAQPSVVFVGGPVRPGAAICLARVAGHSGSDAMGTDGYGEVDSGETSVDESSGWTRLVGELGTLDLEQDPDHLSLGVQAIRVFAGYAGWGPGQLEREIDAGAWFVVPAQPEDVMSDNPESLWKRVLRRQGGELAVVSLFPSDPSLN